MGVYKLEIDFFDYDKKEKLFSKVEKEKKPYKAFALRNKDINKKTATVFMKLKEGYLINNIEIDNLQEYLSNAVLRDLNGETVYDDDN